MTECEQAHLTADTVLRMLANRHRRHALRSLSTTEKPMALADLANEVAVRETGSSSSDVSADAVTRIYLELFHAQIPKLADEQLVCYDRDRNVVSLSKRASHHEQLHELLTVDSYGRE